MKEKLISQRIDELICAIDKKQHELELCELHLLLEDDEELEALASAYSADKNWLLCITNRRAFAYSQSVNKEITQIPIDTIKSVDLDKGFTQNDLIIQFEKNTLCYTMDISSSRKASYILHCLMNNQEIDRNINFNNSYVVILKLILVMTFIVYMIYYIYNSERLV